VLIFDVPREKIWCEITGQLTFPKELFSATSSPTINQAFNHVFYIAARAGVATFCFAWGMGWKSAKERRRWHRKPDGLMQNAYLCGGIYRNT
jgi:hypothetical protein